MMDPLILIGGGGHCISCIDVIEQQGKYQINGIVDQAVNMGKKVLSYEIFAQDSQIPELANRFQNFFITLGQIKTSEKRMALYHLLRTHGAKFPIIISPTSYVSKHAQINEGTIIHHGAFVNAASVVMQNCIINSKALLEHGVEVQAHCHIATGAIINGDVRIGEGAFIGSGTIVKQGIKIGSNSVIGAGLRVMNDVSSDTVLKKSN